jgi:peptidoglycan hydrolase-like protein with peptidoglycan-binding domain
MKLTHVVIAASTAFLSLGALAEGNKAGHDKRVESSASSSMQSQGTASASVIKQAQQKLSAAGHDAGAADGILGQKTAKALKDFQQAKGIEATGQLDARTLAALGVESSATGATAGTGASAAAGAQGSAGASTESRPSASSEMKSGASGSAKY